MPYSFKPHRVGLYGGFKVHDAGNLSCHAGHSVVYLFRLMLDDVFCCGSEHTVKQREGESPLLLRLALLKCLY